MLQVIISPAKQMRAALGELHILAEDLGDLDAGVYSLLAETGLPTLCARDGSPPPRTARYRAE